MGKVGKSEGKEQDDGDGNVKAVEEAGNSNDEDKDIFIELSVEGRGETLVQRLERLLAVRPR